MSEIKLKAVSVYAIESVYDRYEMIVPGTYVKAKAERCEGLVISVFDDLALVIWSGGRLPFWMGRTTMIQQSFQTMNERDDAKMQAVNKSCMKHFIRRT